MAASACAAAMHIVSVTRVAREASTPSARPGKMYELFVCVMRRGVPSKSIVPKGLPVPMIAAPFDQRNRSAGFASQRLVGFESGKMTGRAVLACHRSHDLLR